jgi:hypothetical protein
VLYCTVLYCTVLNVPYFTVLHCHYTACSSIPLHVTSDSRSCTLQSTLALVLDSARTVLTRQRACTPVRTRGHDFMCYAVETSAAVGGGRGEGQLGRGIWRGTQSACAWVSKKENGGERVVHRGRKGEEER